MNWSFWILMCLNLFFKQISSFTSLCLSFFYSHSQSFGFSSALIWTFSIDYNLWAKNIFIFIFLGFLVSSGTENRILMKITRYTTDIGTISAIFISPIFKKTPLQCNCFHIKSDKINTYIDISEIWLYKKELWSGSR